MRFLTVLLTAIIAFIIGFYVHQFPKAAVASVPLPVPTLPDDHNPVGINMATPSLNAKAAPESMKFWIENPSKGCTTRTKRCYVVIQYVPLHGPACDQAYYSKEDCALQGCRSDSMCMHFQGPAYVTHIDRKSRAHQRDAQPKWVNGVVILKPAAH